MRRDENDLFRAITQPREEIAISSTLYAEVDEDTWAKDGGTFMLIERQPEDAVHHDVVVCIEDVPALIAGLLKIMYMRRVKLGELPGQQNGEHSEYHYTPPELRNPFEHMGDE